MSATNTPGKSSCRDYSTPASVLLRGGEYVGAISGIKDWREYLVEIDRLLAVEASESPGFDLGKVCGAGH